MTTNMHELVLPDSGADLEWQQRALCAETDPEAFFPEKGCSPADAMRICNGFTDRFGELHAGCEVRDECLAYALATDQRFGVWGGASERQRRRLMKAEAA